MFDLVEKDFPRVLVPMFLLLLLTLWLAFRRGAEVWLSFATLIFSALGLFYIELAAPFEMALPSFLEHLKVLESSGLVRSRKTGRVRTYQLAPRRLRIAEHWLSRQRALWEQRFDQLDSYLMELKEKDRP
jgi:DNA-binding transcriptional ArsR family regulator